MREGFIIYMETVYDKLYLAYIYIDLTVLNEFLCNIYDTYIQIYISKTNVYDLITPLILDPSLGGEFFGISEDEHFSSVRWL